MGLVVSSLKSDLDSLFNKTNPSPTDVGSQVTSAYEKYLLQGMNAGSGAVTVVAQTAAAGQILGVTYQSYLPSVSVASNIADALTVMAMSIVSVYQTSIVATSGPLLPKLIQLYSSYPSTSKQFSDGFADALDSWTKSFIVSGIIPGAPSIPFTGPLS